jgi:hypothetical protein
MHELYSVSDKRTNMEHWQNKNESSGKTKQVLVAKPNPVPLRPSQILPSSKNSGICPLPCQSLHVKIPLQHSASVQFKRCKMYAITIVPTAHNGGCKRISRAT